MFGVARHLRVLVVVVLAVFGGVFPLRVAAATTATSLAVATEPRIIFTEVQLSGASSSDEFIELYNLSDSDIDLADATGGGKSVWKLQFFGAPSVANGTPDWTKPAATVSLTGTIPAHDYWLVSASGYAPGGLDGDQSYNARLSDSGGGLQLVETDGTALSVHDRLMWLAAEAGKVLPAEVLPAPEPGSSLQRMPTDEDMYTNPDGSLTAFQAETNISPKDEWQEQVVVTPDPTSSDPATDTTNMDSPDGAADPGGGAAATGPVDNTGLQSLFITELLPNPASPLSDTTDEYIELYNPNDQPFDLEGYSLEVGTTTLHDFTFGSDVIVPPLSYQAFYSVDTHLSLTNTGGLAKLLSPDGTAASQTDLYGAADEDMAWAFDGSQWAWTTDSTPGAANVMVVPVTASSSTTKAAAAKLAAARTTKPAAKAKVTGTSKTKKTTAAKAKAKKQPKAKIATVAQTIMQPQQTPIHTGVLAAVVILAVLYAAYEYRHDIRNYVYGLRRNRAVRAVARQ